MDYLKLVDEYEQFDKVEKDLFDSANYEVTEDEKEHPFGSDMVNSPYHYKRGKTEVIDIIEDAVKDAVGMPEAVLQGNVLKYILRMWAKHNALEDAKKAQWYLNRLISKLEESDDEEDEILFKI